MTTWDVCNGKGAALPLCPRTKTPSICTDAACFIDSSYLKSAAHVHVHRLTDDWEKEFLGYQRVEVCCHGCGTSLLLYLDNDSSAEHLIRAARFEMEQEHKNCPDFSFHLWCPNVRTRFEIRDLRTAARRAPTQEV